MQSLITGLLFILHLEIVIRRIKNICAYVSILSSRSETISTWMERQRVDWSEMTFEGRKLFLEYQMEKTSIEFPMPGRCCGYIHGILASAQNDLVKYYSIKQTMQKRNSWKLLKNFTWSWMGEMIAELTGRSVLYVFKCTKDSLSKSLAVWSFDAVMIIVPSLLICISLMRLLCASMELIFFPVCRGNKYSFVNFDNCSKKCYIFISSSDNCKI